MINFRLHITFSVFAATGVFTFFGALSNAQTLDSDESLDSYLRCYNVSTNEGERYWQCRPSSQRDNIESLNSPANKDDPAAFDFISSHLLSEADQNKVHAGCSGTYRAPNWQVQGQPGIKTEESDLIIEADTSVLSGTQKATLTGDVFVSQGPRVVRADLMEYDSQTQSALLQGGVSIRNPGVIIRGEKAVMQTTENRASFEQAMFVLHSQHLRGGASKIERTQDGAIRLEDGRITTCEPNSNGWSLSGSSIVIDHAKGQGYGRNITLKIGSIPVIYTPYVAFPLGDERKSGLLLPEISSSDNGGLNISLPYYFNLAPNYDATITPRLVSGRGAMLEAEGRYLNRTFYNEAKIGFLPQDDGGADEDVDTLIAQGTISEAEARPHKDQDRWLINFNQQGGAVSQAGWYSSISFTKVSDIDYFRDTGDSSFESQNQSFITQLAEAGYLFDNWTVSALIQDNQVLLSDLDNPYKKEPQVIATGQYSTGKINYSLRNDLTRFSHSSQTFRDGRDIITGTRFAGDYRISAPMVGQWGHIIPEVGYKALSYALDTDALNNAQTASPSLGAAQASLDISFVFENNRGRFLKTIEPRAYTLLRQFTSHEDLFNVTADGQDINFDTSARTFSYSQLFRDSRFSGYDRLDDASQTTLGFTSRWIDSLNTTRSLEVSMGQIFNFKDRRVGLRGSDQETEQTSELAADVHLQLGPLASYYVNSIYDTKSKRITRASSGLTYARDDNSTLYDISYSYVRDYRQTSIAAGTTSAQDIDQIDLAIVKPLNTQWRLMGRYNYDFTQNQELEAFIGFEYNDCCYRLLMLARHWLDSNIASLSVDEDLEYDQGIFFELHLKGLGGSGEKVTKLLKESIRGYREREH